MLDAIAAEAHRHKTLVEMVQSRAENMPDATVYSFLGSEVTVEDSRTATGLDRRARAIAQALTDLANVGDRAILLYPPGLDFLDAFFGSLYAGVIAVPVSPPHPARLEKTMPRLLAIARNAGPAVILTTQTLRLACEDIVKTHESFGNVNWLVTEDVPDSLGDSWAVPAVSPDSLAYLQYTSGSTALPKGVAISHDNVLSNYATLSAAYNHEPGLNVVNWLPHFHDLGLVYGLTWPFYAGHNVYTMSPMHFMQRPVRWLKALSACGAVYSGGPNFAYDLCVANVTDVEREGLDLSRWEVALNGAEPIRPATLQAFAETYGPFGFRREAFSPGYGMAEIVLKVSCPPMGTGAPIVTVSKAALVSHKVAAEPDTSNGYRLVGCGLPSLDTEVRIVNPETLCLCEPDEVGEIWLAGSTMPQGYWDNPAMTEAAYGAHIVDLDGGPYLRTGDLGFIRDGNIYITGRMKDLIIVRGANHYPQDIEITAATSHPACLADWACAFVVETQNEEHLVVAQALDRKAMRDIRALDETGQMREYARIQHAIRRAIVEEHDIQPYAVLIVPQRAISKTSSGKVQRSACCAAYQNGTLEILAVDTIDSSAAVPDMHGAEMEKAAAVLRAADHLTEPALRDYLQTLAAYTLQRIREDIQMDASLIDLGLDSLKTVEILGRLERDTGVSLEPKDLFDCESIYALAELIIARLAGGLVAPSAQDTAPDEVEEGSI